ncbi:hypothetical protein CTAYLR_007447 [Chrysophaeum taylorii]|uniref:ATP-dependent DNA helicase n=1 Tax=Chrysophaeum taylorii TaxID=2483200 RepID=A0AAD7U7U9_9STRA|nr:hypothetical protein CTAYLR_007447 [Chrysophaeum taylorii]
MARSKKIHDNVCGACARRDPTDFGGATLRLKDIPDDNFEWLEFSDGSRVDELDKDKFDPNDAATLDVANAFLAGNDFGRLRLRDVRLRDSSRTFDFDFQLPRFWPTQLEALPLATHRVCVVLTKLVVRWKSKTSRHVRMRGHGIVFGQRAVTKNTTLAFSEAAVLAALKYIAMYVVGPKVGKRGELERKALQLTDLTLRPWVVFNWLNILACAPGPIHVHETRSETFAGASLDWNTFCRKYEATFKKLTTKDTADNLNAIERHVVENSVHIANNDQAEDAAAATDVAQVRASARDDDDDSKTDYDMDDADDTSDFPTKENLDRDVPIPREGTDLDSALYWHERLEAEAPHLLFHLNNYDNDLERPPSEKPSFPNVHDPVHQNQNDDTDEAPDDNSAIVVATFEDDDDADVRATPENAERQRRRSLAGMSHVGVFPASQETMGSVARSIIKTVTTTVETPPDVDNDQPAEDAADNEDIRADVTDMPTIPGAGPPAPATAAPAAAPTPSISLVRTDTPIDDYASAPDLYIGAWPHLFPRGRGLPRGKCIPRGTYRHMVLFADGRFARDLSFLAYAANSIKRHAINRGFAGRVKSDQFEGHKPFQDSANLVPRVMKFVHLGSSEQPWSGSQRRADMTTLLATLRHYGAASYFFTIAPDDVHNLVAARLMFPWRGYQRLPSSDAPDYDDVFVTQVRASQDSDRHVRETHMTETAIRERAAHNPVSCALLFDFLLRLVVEDVLAVPSGNDKADFPIRHRPKGVFGRLAGAFGVCETNQRDSLHSHMKLFGGATPAFIADVVEHDDLRAALCAAIDKHVSGELPLALHAGSEARTALRLAARRDAAAAIPNDPAAFKQSALLTRTNRNNHDKHHHQTRTKGAAGKTGCRLHCKCSHNNASTMFRQTEDLPCDDEGRVLMENLEDDDDHDDLRIACRICELTRPRHIDRRADARRRDLTALNATTGQPSFEVKDPRVLVFDLKRRRLDLAVEEDTPSSAPTCALLAAISARHHGRLNFDDTPQGDADRRALLRMLLADGQDLSEIAKTPGHELLASRLDELAKADLENPKDVRDLRALLDALVNVAFLCNNGYQVDANDVVSGLAGCNAVPYLVGVGTSGKAVGVYLLKYMTKEGDEIKICASLVVDAYENRNAGALRATPRATPRERRRDVMPVSVCAAILLQQASSFASETFIFRSPWDHVRVALIAKAAAAALASSHANNDDDDDRPADAAIAQTYAAAEAAYVANPDNDEEKRAADAENDASATADDVAPDATLTALTRAAAGDDPLPTTFRCSKTYRMRDPATGIYVPIHKTDAETYAYRDARLAYLTALEFHAMFDLEKRRKQTNHPSADNPLLLTTAADDTEDADGDDNAANDAHTAHSASTATTARRKRRPGRPPNGRFELRRGHPLAASHWFIRKSKSAVVKLAGHAPPTLDRTNPESRRRWAFYASAWFAPWIYHEDYAAPDLTLDAFDDYYAHLQDTACLFEDREPDESPSAPSEENERRRRLATRRAVAAGRIHAINTLRDGGADSTGTSPRLPRAHRGRQRTLWADHPGAAPTANFASNTDVNHDGAATINKAQAHREKMANAPGMATRLQRAVDLDAFFATLAATIPRAPLSLAATQRAALAGDCTASDRAARATAAWPLAALAASRRTFAKHTYAKNPEEAARAMCAPIPPKPRIRPGDATTALRGVGGGATPRLGDDVASTAATIIANIATPAQFAEIDDARWHELSRAWREDAANSTRCSAPLNPEQRIVGRYWYTCLRVSETGLRDKYTLREAATIVKHNDLSLVTLLMGAGGTGKSAVIESSRRAVEEGLGHIVCTGYTGVSAAAFGAATLLSLFDLGIARPRHVPDRSSFTGSKQHEARTKFQALCGVTYDDIAGLVIDEISFVDAALIGHVDACARALTGAWDVPFGGIPVLLAGDNFQEPMPGGEDWYKTMVNRALAPSSTMETSRHATSAGLRILAAAPVFELTRIMRAVHDPPFIDAMLAMRARWAFAPVGVLNHAERDTINIDFLHKFAAFCGLPLVKWRLPLDFDGVLANVEDDDVIYDAEPVLWGYFVEGAPVLITVTFTFKSKRRVVNGTPGLLEALSFADDTIPDALERAYAHGGFTIVKLDEPPVAFMVHVGSKVARARTQTDNDAPPTSTPPASPPRPSWHGIPLPDYEDDLGTGFIANNNDTTLRPPHGPVLDDADGQVVPFLVGKKPVQVDLYSKTAAANNIEATPKARCHTHMLAFALADYKLQGRTLPRLVINLPHRKKLPWMTLVAFYVLVSRVTTRAGLRFLMKDDRAIDALVELRHNAHLHAWLHGYDSNRCWNPEKASDAYACRVADLEAEKKRHAKRRDPRPHNTPRKTRQKTTPAPAPILPPTLPRTDTNHAPPLSLAPTRVHVNTS